MKAATKEEVNPLNITTFERSLSMLEVALEIYPEDPDLNFQAASLCDGLGNDDKAVGYYEKAIELGLKASDLKSAILSLGISYHCLGLMEKSRKLIEAAVSHFPDDKPLQIFKFVANTGLANDKQTIKSHLDHFARELENLDITDLEVALKKFTNNLQPVAAE